MSYGERYVDDYTQDLFAVDATLEARAAFIRRTYLHVFGAIVAFVVLETIILSIPAIAVPLATMIGGNWWMALIAFMIVSWVAQYWANSGASQNTQYLGLALYVIAEAIIFVPLLFIAENFGSDGLIPMAALVTLMIFGGLTAVVFVTKQDFSFLRNILWLGTIAALGIIIAGAFAGFTLGLGFVSLMIVLMSGFILYDTSNILHHYRTDQHVGAALALFGSIATLFWYVIQLFLLSDD